MLREKLLEEAKKLPFVSLAAANQYNQQRDRLRTQVDAELGNDPDIFRYVDSRLHDLMYANHQYHVKFMANVFQYNNYELLANIVIWVYRSYHAHGFSYGYFRLALAAWQRAIQEHLDQKHAQEINRIYRWLQSKHDEMISLAETDDCEILPVGELTTTQKTFVDLLLMGDFHSCIGMAKHFVQKNSDLGIFYGEVLQPCLYEIGRRWETGVISVAHEHLALAVVNRIMTSCFLDLKIEIPNKGGALITAAPNELHEVGARMVADLLEIHGWDVDYLGANTPTGEVMELLRLRKPFILGISAVMPFNLAEVEMAIRAIKSDPVLQPIQVMVGGLAFVHTPGLARQIGADGYAANLSEAVELAENWWKGRA